jgi:hypothetical protein
MSKKSVAFTVFVAFCLASVALVGTAGALSISVTEEGSSISVEVTDDDAPVENADVTISGVTEETPLDGEYTTDGEGMVVFDGEGVSELSGVVHLRITVDTGSSYKSALATVTRSPELDSSPMGQRMSMSLQESVSETRGVIESRMSVEMSTASEIRQTAEDVDEMLVSLSNVRFERQALGRNLATGDISVSEFYLRSVEYTGEEIMLKNSIEETVRYLDGFGNETLSQNGVNTDELNALIQEIEGNQDINADERLTDGS